MKESTLKKFLRLPEFDEHLELHRIDCLSSHGLLDAYDYAREKSHSLPPEAIRPPPLVTGRDLIERDTSPARGSKKFCRPSRMRNWKDELPPATPRWSLCTRIPA